MDLFDRIYELDRILAARALAADGAVLHLCAFNLPGEESRRPTDDGGTIRRRRPGRRPPGNWCRVPPPSSVREPVEVAAA